MSCNQMSQTRANELFTLSTGRALYLHDHLGLYWVQRSLLNVAIGEEPNEL